MRTAMVALLLLTTSLVTVTAPGGAHSDATPGLIDVEKHIDGADTYMFSIRSSESFNLLNTSTFAVTGNFPTNGTTAPRQDVGAVVGVVRWFSSSCPTAAGDDPCFFSMVGDSIKDSYDAQVTTQAPVSFSFETDPNNAGFASFTTGVQYQGIRGFQKEHPTDGFVTFRFFVSIPGASSIDVDIHFHANKPISIRDEVAHDGGFLFLGDDQEPSAHADTLPVQTFVDGEVVVPFQANPGERMYAIHSPSWFGTSVLDAGAIVAVRHNTAAVTHLGVTEPNGRTTAGTAFALGGPAGVGVVGTTQAGDWTFFTDFHVGVGPQDVYTVGFKGPVAD